jgi:hypothetical protein
VPEAPAPGWAELMQRCWASIPEARPSFVEIVPALEDMLRAAKAARQQQQQQQPGAAAT